ncbi:MAG: flagellin N-terminal helical domain-containing protein, partial [Planctomycetota bacterium]
MLAIKNNLMAATAARQLGINYDALARSVERLSSGLRINSARDDAAGLAVRELMRADIAVLQQGARNAQDGISLLQTMEGAMQTIDDALVRMKQLAQQAVTGTYSDAQRIIMNSEFAEMAQEIERIATATKFNDTTYLDNTDSVIIQVGDSANTITVDGVDMTQAGLGIETGSGLWSAMTSINADGDGEGAYATTTETALTLTGAGTTLTIDIDFTDSVGTDQEQIQVSFDFDTSATYSLEDIRDAINLVSNNPTQQYDENGRFLGYSAASIEETAAGTYRLKLSARDADIDGMTVALSASATTIAGIFGTDETVGTLMKNEVFQKWDEATSDWIDDTAGIADTGINILTIDSANSAMTAMTSAIITKDTARAAFGYKMNRMEYTVAVINIQAENMVAAESRIS